MVVGYQLGRVDLGRLLMGLGAEAGSLWPFLQNAGGAESGVGNMARDGREVRGFKDSDLGF